MSFLDFLAGSSDTPPKGATFTYTNKGVVPNQPASSPIAPITNFVSKLAKNVSSANINSPAFQRDKGNLDAAVSTGNAIAGTFARLGGSTYDTLDMLSNIDDSTKFLTPGISLFHLPSPIRPAAEYLKPKLEKFDTSVKDTMKQYIPQVNQESAPFKFSEKWISDPLLVGGEALKVAKPIGKLAVKGVEELPRAIKAFKEAETTHPLLKKIAGTEGFVNPTQMFDDAKSVFKPSEVAPNRLLSKNTPPPATDIITPVEPPKKVRGTVERLVQEGEPEALLNEKRAYYTPQKSKQMLTAISQKSTKEIQDTLASYNKLSPDDFVKMSTDGRNDAILHYAALLNKTAKAGNVVPRMKASLDAAEKLTAAAHMVEQAKYLRSSPGDFVQQVVDQADEAGKLFGEYGKGTTIPKDLQKKLYASAEERYAAQKELDTAQQIHEKLIKDFQTKKTPKIQQDLAAAAQRVSDASAKVERLTSRMKQDVDSYVGKTWYDIIHTSIQLNLLRPSSLLLNLAYNVSAAPATLLKNNTAALASWIHSSITGAPRLTYGTLGEGYVDTARAVGRQLKKDTVSILKGGEPSLDMRSYDEAKELHPLNALHDVVNEVKKYINTGKTDLSANAIAKKLVEGVHGGLSGSKIVAQVLALGDTPSKLFFYNFKLRELALRHGLPVEDVLQAPSKAFRDEALEYAMKETYQNDNKVVEVLNKFTVPQKGDSKKVIAAKLALSTTMAIFKRTPTNIGSDVATYIFYPVSIIRGIAGMALAKDPKKLEQAYDLFARGMVGYAASSLGYWLAEKGIVTPPQNPLSAYSRQAGEMVAPSNSFNVSALWRIISSGDASDENAKRRNDDTYISNLALGPIGAVWGTNASMFEQGYKEFASEVLDLNLRGAASSMFGMTEGGVKFLLDLPMLQSIDGLVSAFGGIGSTPDRIDKFIASAVSPWVYGVVPATYQAIGKSMQDVMPDTRKAKSAASTYDSRDLTSHLQNISDMVGNITTRGSFTPSDLPPRYGPFGIELQRTPGNANPIWYQIFDPLKAQSPTYSDALKKIYDLRNETHDESVIPQEATYIPVNIYGQRYELHPDPWQLAEYNRFIGDQQGRLATSLLNNPEFNQLDAYGQVKMLKDMYGEGRKRASQYFVNQYGLPELLDQEGIGIASTLDQLPNDQQREQYLQDLQNTKPILYQSYQKYSGEKQAFLKDVYRLRELSPTNGTRAAAVKKMVDSFSPDKRKGIYNELRRLRLVTPDVHQQLIKLAS